MLEDLSSFVQSNPDARELKRTVAVQMFLKGFKHRVIGESLGVSSGFISKWTQRYQELGVWSLQLAYLGSNGYLDPEQRQEMIDWLKHNNYWNLTELRQQIEQEYEVRFDSKQSYYTLFEQAGISWKKRKSVIPRQTPN